MESGGGDGLLSVWVLSLLLGPRPRRELGGEPRGADPAGDRREDIAQVRPRVDAQPPTRRAQRRDRREPPRARVAAAKHPGVAPEGDPADLALDFARVQR